jgi:hypothetical protein
MCHVLDHGNHSLDRSERELRAFLIELELAPVAARYLRLGIIATGGDPSASEDPYEVANFELVAGFVRALANDATLAPQIDRARNLQAQLDRLEPEEIAEIARRIAASRAISRK